MRLRRNPCLLAILAAFAAGCPAPQQAADAGAPATGDGPVAPLDAGAVELVGDAGPADPAVALRVTVEALRGLLNDELPDDLDPQSLFGVDLLDEAAIATRIRELRVALNAQVLDAGPADARVPEAGLLEAGLPEGGLLEAGAELDAGPDPDAGPGDEAGSSDGGLDGGPPDVGPPDAGIDGAIAALTQERDRLRLRFLERPLDERATVLEAVRARRRIALDERASREEEVRARVEARRATAARDEALSQAANTESAIERDLLAERAQVETARADLARWLAARAARRQEEARASGARLQRIHELELHLATLDPEEADERYDSTVAHMASERRRLWRVLGDLQDGESTAPRLELALDLDSRLYRAVPGRDEVVEAFESFERDRAAAIASEDRLLWARAETLATDLRQLDRLRLELLPRLSGAHRDDVLGFGSLGRGQLSGELEQAQLLGTYWFRHAWHEAPELPERFGALFLRSGTRTDILLLAAWIIAVVVLWRQRDPLTEQMRKWVHRRAGRRTWLGLLRPFWAVFGPLLVPLALLGALHVMLGLLQDLGDSIVVDLLALVGSRVAWFYLLTLAATRFFVSRLRHGSARAATARRILGSVRMVMGYGLVAVLVVDLSELFVGQGHLHGVVAGLAKVGALPLVALLLHQWADDVCAAHQERYPQGFVARSLERNDTGLRRRLLTAIAALQLAVSGTYSALKELSLRFEQSRRAFAFLFRRRLERRKESTVDESEVRALPEALLEAFTEGPAPTDLAIDHFPAMDGVAEQLTEFVDGGAGFTCAVVGERGVGKTTWMRELVQRTDVRAEILDVPHRLIHVADVCKWLSGALELSPTEDIDDLAGQLNEAQTRRVILLDGCQNLVVRAIGGTVGLETLLELAANTSESVVWVCSFARYTWMYLERNRQGQDLFTTNVSLERWTESQIAQLVRHRMDVAGENASFADLVVDQLDGSALEDAVLRTEGEYLRLLWDFAEGNPRVAIHYWLHSLVDRGDELRVRLFAAPDIDQLEALHEESRFLLATIALHENATAEEAAASLGTTVRQCASLLAYLRAKKYVRRDPQGQWRITTHWYRGVIRYLRRRRLLFD